MGKSAADKGKKRGRSGTRKAKDKNGDSKIGYDYDADAEMFFKHANNR